MRRVLFGVCLVWCIVTTAARAQRRPSFTSASATVPLFVTVTDGAGRPVPDLTATDFVVLDNGQPQPLTVFGIGSVPVSLVVLLDDSPSMAERIGSIREGASRFFEHLRESDLVELGSFNRVIQFARPFANDVKQFQLALLTMPPVDYGTALWDALDESVSELDGQTNRRVIVIFTDGEGNMGRTTAKKVLAHARASNVMVYVIRIVTTRTFRGQTGTSVMDPLLPALAQDTGGDYFDPPNMSDMTTMFVHVAEELHSQYVLGFESTHLDGRMHTLGIRLSRTGLLARGRNSYVASPLRRR